MHILQPRARRAHRHPPTNLYSPIVAGVLPSPCFPNFLARTTFVLETSPEAKIPGQDAFLGATDIKQIGTLPKGWQLKSSIKSFVTFRGGGREGGGGGEFSLGLFQLSQLSWISNFSTSPTFSSSPNSVSSFTLLISTLPALPIFYFKIGRAWRAQSIRRMKELTESGELEKLGEIEKLEIQES